ncbi:MAG: enoyl-CoA hydratase/isomerase family protein [Dehalococcoidia bacterium]|nr:enoyl-CoA hydratase/isomerase family protein [Dehalococcoidia bacterium]
MYRLTASSRGLSELAPTDIILSCGYSQIMANEYKTIIYQKEDGIATVTFNRPAALNAFDSQMRREMSQVWLDLEKDDEVLVGIVTGAGRAFCSGLDLKEAASRERSGQEPQERDVPFGELIPTMVTKPLIAAVNGAAAGGGLGLMLACDVAICSEEAVFVAPFAARGLMDAQTLTLLTRKVPPVWAMWMALSAERFDAQTAVRIGLVKEVLSKDDLIPRATEMAERLTSHSQEALKAIKEKMLAALNGTVADAVKQVGPMEEALRNSSARQEGMSAFAEKRRPRF